MCWSNYPTLSPEIPISTVRKRFNVKINTPFLETQERKYFEILTRTKLKIKMTVVVFKINSVERSFVVDNDFKILKSLSGCHTSCRNTFPKQAKNMYVELDYP